MPQRHGLDHRELLDAVLDALGDGVIVMDCQHRIVAFNRTAEQVVGVAREHALGRRCCDVLRSSICVSECAFDQILATGQASISRTVQIQSRERGRVPISIISSPLRDAAGEIIGGVETIRDVSLVEALRKKLTGRYTRYDIISKNHRMRQMLDLLPDIAASDAAVLLEGESGTGKDLFARAVHELSERRARPLVVINCAALPDSLLESELFGYKSGAFTDARRDKPGRFALAEGGTIFLDEIGDISPALQVRLLRVLQEGTNEPLGATHPEHANVRVVTATNRNLAELVRLGQFREDLFYRINIVRLELPPLRERPEDIPLLVDHFISHFNQLRGKEITGISEAALGRLTTHDWPGNVRELEHVIEYAFIVCPQGRIESEHLPPAAFQAGLGRRPAPQSAEMAAGEHGDDRESLIRALRRNHWNRQRTAQQLGIHKATLFRRIKALGIELPSVDGRHRFPDDEADS